MNRIITNYLITQIAQFTPPVQLKPQTNPTQANQQSKPTTTINPKQHKKGTFPQERPFSLGYKSINY